MAKAAELQYRTVQWDDSLLQPAVKTPAGPLFNITCSENAVRQLHLPHCEIKEALCVDGLLSVAHISNHKINFLEPLEITATHVVVNVPHLSDFGLTWDCVKRTYNSINGHVLVFCKTLRTGLRSLDMFLIPGNIPWIEVAAQQENGDGYIEFSAPILLNSGQSYSAEGGPETRTEPEQAQFHSRFGPTYRPTFQLFLTTNPNILTLIIKNQRGEVIWQTSFSLSDLVITAVGKAVTSVGGAMTSVGGALTNLGRAVADVGGTVTSAGRAMTCVGGAVTTVSGVLPDVGGALPDAGGAVTAVGGAVTAVGGAVTAVGGVMTTAGGAMTDMGGAMTDAGVTLTTAGGAVTDVGGAVTMRAEP
ncbi:NACHT, LRR and PYD domains-containing protein 1b allele 2-like isoform X2 [Simochromis diagramma]|nr:NACHT, LRR and PYD domains-containing protein 1b allele 2-like isoform X2 [Simochromis diagramma]